MRFEVGSADSARDALTYFNYFHDSFLERIEVQISTEGHEQFGFAIPVRYDASIFLVHTNYNTFKSQGQCRPRVALSLSHISHMMIGDVVPLDNMLSECCISIREPGEVHLDVGGDGLVTFDCRLLVIDDSVTPPGEFGLS